MFAEQFAVAVESLDADIVEIGAAMDARAYRRLGDEKKPWQFQERADFRSDGERLVPALQRPHVGRPQETETGREVRFEHRAIAGENIIAGAEQREIIPGEPFQKLDRLRYLGCGKRRRVGTQFGDHFAYPRQHRAPILNTLAHVGEDLAKRADDVCALRGIRRAVDVDVNEAFALALILGHAVERGQSSCGVALDD